MKPVKVNSENTFGLHHLQLKEIKKIISENKKVEQAILFGSRAMGTYKPGSDIDIAVKGKDIRSMDAANIQFELEETFLPYFFDVIAYSTIDNPDLVNHINRVGQKIYQAI